MTEVDTSAAAEAPAGDAGESAQFDPSALTDRIDQMQTSVTSGLESLNSRFEQFQPPVQQQQRPDNPFAALLGEQPQSNDFGFEDEGDYVDLDPEAMNSIVQEQIKKGVDAEVGPVREMVQQMLANQQAEKIQEQYPELRDSKVAAEVVAEGVVYAQTFGLDEQTAEGLANSPSFMKLVHEARRGNALASQITQTSGQGGSDGLEAAGGVQPGAANTDAQQQQAVDGIVQQRKGLFD